VLPGAVSHRHAHGEGQDNLEEDPAR
jgi:hypothetical protein